MTLKVGDIVRAINNSYHFTNIENKWVGRVVAKVSSDEGYFSGETISFDSNDDADYIGKVWGGLNVRDFEVVSRKSDNFNSLYEKLNGETR